MKKGIVLSALLSAAVLLMSGFVSCSSDDSGSSSSNSSSSVKTKETEETESNSFDGKVFTYTDKDDMLWKFVFTSESEGYYSFESDIVKTQKRPFSYSETSKNKGRAICDNGSNITFELVGKKLVTSGDMDFIFKLKE